MLRPRENFATRVRDALEAMGPSTMSDLRAVLACDDATLRAHLWLHCHRGIKGGWSDAYGWQREIRGGDEFVRLWFYTGLSRAAALVRDSEDPTEEDER